MLNQIDIQGFQSHKDTTVVLSPKTTAIVGESNNGKTAILRDIRWIVDNRPLGDKYINKSLSECNSSLIFDGIQISRRKSKSVNEYRFISNGEVETFTAFGDNPPPIISEALNLSDLNIQQQFDGYFLLTDSPNQIATYIRSITNLDEIDAVVKLLSSRIRENSSETKRVKSELSDVSYKLQQLRLIDLESLERHVKECVGLEKDVEKKNEDIESLSGLIDDLQDIEIRLVILPPETDGLLLDVEHTVSEYAVKKDVVEELSRLIDDYTDVEQQIVGFPSDIDEIIDIEQLLSSYNNICSDVVELSNAIEEFEESEQRFIENDKMLQRLRDDERELLSSLTICPHCESELTDVTKFNLLNNEI